MTVEKKSCCHDNRTCIHFAALCCIVRYVATHHRIMRRHDAGFCMHLIVPQLLVQVSYISTQTLLSGWRFHLSSSVTCSAS